MRKNRILLLLALALLAAGCAQNDDMNSNTPGNTVRFAVDIAQTSATRTTHSGEGWASGDQIGIFMLASADVLESNVPYTVEDATTGSLTGTPMYYPMDGSEVSFISYYPWADNAPLGNIDVVIGNQTEQPAFDLLYATADEGYSKTSADVVALAFEHKLSKIVMNTTADPSIGAALAGMTVTIRGLKTENTFDLATGTLDTPATVADITPRILTDGASYDAIIMPGAYADGEVTVDFKIGDDTFTWRVGAITFESGKRYTYDVTITRTAITATGSITPWEAERRGTVSPEIMKDNIAIFTNGSTAEITAQPTPEGIYEISFDNATEVGDTLYSVTLNDKTYLIGRASNETVTLKLNTFTGELLFRDPDANGNIPIGSRAEFMMIGATAGAMSRSYIQEANIDLLGSAGLEEMRRIWTPIGIDIDTNFDGSYDGGGYTISNLTIDAATNYTGLFRSVGDNGKLSRVAILSGSVKATGREAGALCGYNYGVITDSYYIGSISGTQESVGGLCGCNYGSITDSYHTGTVTGAKEYVGGVCGRNYATITSCYHSGGTVSGSAGYVAGVCGQNDAEGIIDKCYNTAAVDGSGTGEGTSGFYTGGVCGRNYNLVSACSNTGAIHGRTRLGGVCGQNESGGSITEGTNEGRVTGTREYVGGICGFNEGGASITNATNKGVVDGERSYVGGVCGQSNPEAEISASMNSGAVTGRAGYVAGICGRNYDDVTNCSNTGKIVGVGRFDYVGGVCGYSEGHVLFCHNSGAVEGLQMTYIAGVCARSDVGGRIENCYNTGTITGYLNTAGITGQNGVYNVTIACYNTGAINNASSVSAAGVCANNFGYLTACYNKGSVNGYDAVGGVCETNDDWRGIMTECYNVGTMGGESHVASLCTNNDGVINSCFYAGTYAPVNIGNGTAEISQFSSGAWPAWSTSVDGTNGYWKSLGSWNNGSPTYPKLWWEE